MMTEQKAQDTIDRILHFATGGCDMSKSTRLKCIAKECEVAVNDQTNHRQEILELLDVIKLCEAALADYFTSEDGIDEEVSLRIAWRCSELIVKHRFARP